jgi:hypothetical protein
MFNKYIYIFVSLLIISCTENVKNHGLCNRLPSVFPDYTSIVMPVNIAPLNFFINEKGEKFHVDIYSGKGTHIILQQNSPAIDIPVDAWHKLLTENKGNRLNIDIYVKQGKWVKFNTITDSIASEKIESYLVYRLINTGHNFYKNMGIYERNLENHDETPIFENSSSDFVCANCHSFCKANHNKMSLHFRKSRKHIISPGTLILNGNELKKISTRTKYTMSGCVYPAWHPGGDFIAYSVNIINQNFTSEKDKPIDVSDKASDIVIYDIRNNLITTSPKISTKSRENLPTWSPDGKWLYFISAPEAKPNDLDSRLHTKYDLLRIKCNPYKNEWGPVDTVLSSRKTGLSISFPRISPNGKYIIFCMTDFGYFTVFHAKSDLYIMDLNTREYHKLDAVNSLSSESYHTWSQTGSWIVFSSKRLDNLYSRSYFSYFDKNGKVHKPFVLPQKNPLFYNKFLMNYNIPELVDGKIEIDEFETRDLAHTDPISAKFDTTIDIDALSGATKIIK